MQWRGYVMCVCVCVCARARARAFVMKRLLLFRIVLTNTCIGC